jgi:hypothetical protein
MPLLPTLLAVLLASPEAPTSTGASEELATSPLHSRAALLHQPEVYAGGGALSTSYGFHGGRWGELFSVQHLGARWLAGGFTLEGGVLAAQPLGQRDVGTGLTTDLRLGWTWSQLTATAGASLQYAAGAQPRTQLLPTARLEWRPGDFGLSAGVFDVHAIAPARLSVEFRDYGLGFVAPLGLEARARFQLGQRLSLRVQGLAFQAGNAQVALLMISGFLLPGVGS